MAPLNGKVRPPPPPVVEEIVREFPPGVIGPITKRISKIYFDAVRGKALFEGTGQCLNCHRVKDKGSRTGPDLTEIGSVRRLVELERSILEPGAEMFPQNRFVRVVTGDGVTITGRLLNQDTFTVQLMDENEQLRSFQKSILKGYSFIDKSQMPSYKGKLNAQDLTDLVSYLASLKGIDTQ